MKEDYIVFMEKIIWNGLALPVPPDEVNPKPGHVWYLHKPGQIRVVFDFMNSMLGGLIRFRRKRIVVKRDNNNSSSNKNFIYPFDRSIVKTEISVKYKKILKGWLLKITIKLKYLEAKWHCLVLQYLVGNTHTTSIGKTWNTNIWLANIAADKSYEGWKERKLYYNYIWA